MILRSNKDIVYNETKIKTDFLEVLAILLTQQTRLNCFFYNETDNGAKLRAKPVERATWSHVMKLKYLLYALQYFLCWISYLFISKQENDF